MSEDKVKLLNLMRFWLFGTWAIVFAAVTAYIGLFTNQDPLYALRAGAPIWGLTAVLCAIWYFGYKWWLGRSEDAGPAPAAVSAGTAGSPVSVGGTATPPASEGTAGSPASVGGTATPPASAGTAGSPSSAGAATPSAGDEVGEG